MSRYLLYGSLLTRSAHSLIPYLKGKCPRATNIYGYYNVNYHSPSSHIFSSQYKFSPRGSCPYSLYRSKQALYKSYSGAISQHAQVAWKMLSQLYHTRGSALPPINKITCAVSIALTRSNLVAPGVITFIIGELALAKRKFAEAEGLSSRKILYANAQDGRIYLTQFVFSLVEVLIMFLRAIYLAILFWPCISMAPLVDTLGFQFRKRWLRLVHSTLEKAGPAFIKWGQWVATRPDLFPRDLCIELAELQSKAPAHSFSCTKKTIERAFGQNLNEIFDKFEEEPIASGSVAQVHRAVLKYRYPQQKIKPIDVAVKVRHPGVSDWIRRDFIIMNCIAKLSRFIPNLNRLRLDESLQQFAVFMMSQVDLAREAAHLSRFIYNFRSWKDVSFPKPLYPLVHPAVLVETFEPGQSVLYYVDELEGHEWIKSDLAHIGTHALLKMLLVDNFIHADMHPGNILVRVTNSKSSHNPPFRSRPHVIFLDVGMTAELSKKERMTLLEFFKAIALRDGRTAAECTLKLSRKQCCPDPRAFIEDVDKSFVSWNSSEGENVHPAECMHQLLEHVRRHKVNIDGNVTTVMVTTLVLEGWQRKLDPEYDVMSALQRLLFKVDWVESLFYTIEGVMAP